MSNAHFPMLHVDLDRPRVFQFSMQAAKRFRAIRGFEVSEITSRMGAAPGEAIGLFADALWCGLPAVARAEITPELIREHLTLPKIMKLLRQLLGPQTGNN